MAVIKLLDNVDANTTGDAFRTYGSNQTLAVFSDNYSGGTVTIQLSPDGGLHWITLSVNGAPAQFTTDVTYLVDRVSTSYLIRATLTGATTPSNVNAWLAD